MRNFCLGKGDLDENMGAIASITLTIFVYDDIHVCEHIVKLYVS